MPKKKRPDRGTCLSARNITTNSPVVDLLSLNDEEFREKFKGSPVKRAKRRGLLRNATAALWNRNDEDITAALKHALNDPEPLVREGAAWSLQQIRTCREKQAKASDG